MDLNESKKSPVHILEEGVSVKMPDDVDEQRSFDDCINVRVDPEKDSVQLQDASNSRSVEGVSTSNADLAVPVQTRNNKRAMMARRRRLVITEQTTTLESSTDPQSPGYRPLQSLRRVRVPKGYVAGNYRAISRSPAVFTKILKFKVNFNLPNGTVVPMGCSGDHTVAQIKDQLWLIMKDLGILQEDPGLEDKELYSIKYEKDCDTYELFEEQQIFQTLSIVSYWRAKKTPWGEFNIVPKEVETIEEKIMNKEIGKLIGMSLYQLCSSLNNEVNTTRRLFIGVRRSAVSSRDPSTYSMEPELTLEELPPHIHGELQGGTHIIVKIYSGTTFMTTSVPIDYTPFQVLNKYFPQDPLKKERVNLPRESNVTDYVLKVCGRNIYLVGPARISDFTYVRRSIVNHCPIHLAIVPLLDSELDMPRHVQEPDLVDDNTGLVGSYKQLSALNKVYRQVFAMALWDVCNNFRVRINGVDGLDGTLPYKTAFVKVGVFHGGKPLTPMVTTREVPFARSVHWGQRLVLDIKTRNLPKAAQLCCYLYARSADCHLMRKSSQITSTDCFPFQVEIFKSGSENVVLLHWVNMHIMNYRSILTVGKVKLQLWKVLTNSEGSQSFLHTSPIGSTVMHIELDSYAHPVAYPNSDFGWGVVEDRSEEDVRSPVSKYGESRFSSAVDDIVLADPLKELEAHERELIWRLRWNLASKPEALPRLLQTVDWGNLEQVIEIHNLIEKWRAEGITLEVALQLLDSQYVDSEVRKLAVERLEELSNDDLLLYFLQLVQVLKFEPYYDSNLARFLLRRSLHSKRIGHCFYWFLRSEMDIPEVRERFGLLLEAYLRGCGKAMLADLEKQNEALYSFAQIAAKLKSVDKKDRSEYLTSALSALWLPQTFSPAYEPSLRIGKIHKHQCRFMDSKKLPLWLEFENVDPTCANSEPVRVIFKVGDDLRQDMLTLQMIKLMDKLWQEEGMNLYMTPYGCMSTGFEVGMIEVVPHSVTVARIQKDYGGSLGAFKDDCLYNWLKEKNSRTVDFENAVERFVLSCAGYCVATFVLGIGDRHNDNIMLTDSGCLFHIDFGHFLGNTKKFMGFKRERAPFVLTPDFVNIMGKRGSSTFQWFQEICCQAYNAIRRRASLFINLFSMMKHTGIPELASIKDIDYLRSVLVLEKSEAEAAKYFKEKIDACLRLSWSTQLNWMAHSVVHA